METSNTTPVLEIRNVTKTFGSTTALNNIRFDLLPGEVHAIAGENGAGKSTLMKIIDGIHQPDSGEMFINGEKVVVSSPLEAQKLGIGFVHQEIALCSDVSVAENIMMAKINSSAGWLVDYKTLYREAYEVVSQLADIDPRQKVSDLTISNQQLVEIAKALVLDCKILILDEPTAALTDQETDILFAIMQTLKARGISIIYISHRMAEIFEQCDRVSVFRDGHYIHTKRIEDTTPQAIVQSLVGREIANLYPPKCQGQVENNPVILDVEGLSDGQRFNDIDFKVYQGEIFGVAGLIGAGRSEMVKGLCGLHTKQRGNLRFNGQPITINCYRDAIDKGIVYLSEDRKEEGLFLDLSIAVNVSALKLELVSEHGLISKDKEFDQTRTLTDRLNLKSGSLHHKVSSLSGGNQQKVALAKILSVNPKLIILDEPTRGIDVGAKSEIHKLIRDLANTGVGIIVISSELPEVIGLSDRVMVMRESRQMGLLTGDHITEQNIMHLASGSAELTQAAVQA
ncbi:ATP-binding cassette domain-containing protein [Photobacterium halotolerans]|uniref:ATP-binding cassette domain-containing protein n=1 Tax=Photobacterium halotolerans TaxID=265726 RepID=UPI0013732807|nr:ATP-binding cassette domain-containing protein [Photobacterium halotolerans]NAX46727.1 ATP-binding cassette domain-containing protein [Photobacterium halotolerans]